jgi:LysR family transcriptional regulator for bpeEF and oprC
MDQLSAMRVFARVAELGSFARAADALDMSRAMVTTRIAQLEARLGVRLLHRTTRRVGLTDDGRAYHERCLRILADIDETEEALGRGRTRPAGRLRVQAPVALTRHFLIPALPRFLARHPELALEVRLANRVVDLVEEGLDCAIRLGAPAEPALVARRIAETRLATCAAPGYLARRGVPRAPDDLARHDCIAFLDLATGRPADWAFAQRGAQHARAPQGRLAFNSMEAAVEAAAAGLGVAQVLSSLAQGAVAAGRLVPVLVDWAAAGPPLYVAYPHHRHLSAKIRAFVDFAAEVFAGDGGWGAIAAAAGRSGRRPSAPPARRAGARGRAARRC